MQSGEKDTCLVSLPSGLGGKDPPALALRIDLGGEAGSLVAGSGAFTVIDDTGLTSTEPSTPLLAQLVEMSDGVAVIEDRGRLGKPVPRKAAPGSGGCPRRRGRSSGPSSVAWSRLLSTRTAPAPLPAIGGASKLFTCGARAWAGRLWASLRPSSPSLELSPFWDASRPECRLGCWLLAPEGETGLLLASPRRVP